MNKEEIVKEFKCIYGEGDVRTFHSPGRINLIGEHIDYNGGYVFPCALEFGTYGMARMREDNYINLASTNFPLRIKVKLEDITFSKEDDWANYPKGVIKVMMDRGYKVGGMDILISGNIPNGAGLSSSASLEVLIGVIVNNLFNNGKIAMLDIVKLSQFAENNFVGVNCGIMDQFAVGMGRKDQAMLLNCSTLEYKYSKMELGKYSIVIMNTNKRRNLNDSKYNARRGECEEALEIINKVLRKDSREIKALCELTTKEYEALKGYIENPIVEMRARHAVYENERVLRAFACLKDGMLLDFGKLLTQSHKSLKELYEVTGKELDQLVEEALKVKGCIGARMTGAGFGGCAIALIEEEIEEKFINAVKDNYRKAIGYEPSFYTSKVGEGALEIF